MTQILKCSKCGMILSSEYDWLKGYSVARSIVCDVCLNAERNAARSLRNAKLRHPTFDEAITLSKLNKEV